MQWKTNNKEKYSVMLIDKFFRGKNILILHRYLIFLASMLYRILWYYRICLDIAEIKMIHWCRTENCVVMVLSDYSVQINFMSEHYKLIFWQSTDKSANVIVISNHFFHYEAFKKVLCYCSLVLRQVNSLLKLK